MMENPYHWLRVNPNLFYGTERMFMILDICNRLSQGESFAVVGGRRLGKTTFLRRLELEIKRSNRYLYPVYIDAQAMPYVASSDEAFKWICKHVEKAIGMNVEKADQFEEWMGSFLKKKQCLKLVLIIDEFDAFSEYDWCHTFFDNWRALIHNTPGISEHLGIVLAGVRISERLLVRQGSPLANVLSWKYLSLLNEEDTKQLVHEPTKGLFPAKVSEIVWEKTRGHPFLIQFLMHHLCASRMETNFEQVLDQAEQRLRDEHDIIFRQWWFDHIGERERKIYRALVKGATIEEIIQKLGYKAGEVREGLRTLSYVGLVRKLDGHYAVAGLIFNRWLEENDIYLEAFGQQLGADSSLHDIFDELERKLRCFVTKRLREIEELSNLYRVFPEQIKKAHEKYKEENKVDQPCPIEQLIAYTDFAFPFEIILKFWKQFYEVFSLPARDKILGRDPNKAKQRFEERKDVLTRIRNAVRHSRPVDEEDREKARIFCKDILALL